MSTQLVLKLKMTGTHFILFCSVYRKQLGEHNEQNEQLAVFRDLSPRYS